MSHSKPPHLPAAGAGSSIGAALDKNEKAAEEVKQAADDLAVVHAVLDTKLTRGASDADVAKAVAETDKVEKHLTRSAKALDEVNETLRGKAGPAG